MGRRRYGERLIVPTRPSLQEIFTPSGPRRLYEWLSVWVGYRRGPRVASWVRQRWVIARHPLADIRFGRNVYVGPRFSRVLVLARGDHGRLGVRTAARHRRARERGGARHG